MKKNLFVLFILMISAVNSFADCRDIAKKNKVKLFQSPSDEQFWIAGGAYVGSMFIPAVSGASFIAAVPFAIAAPGVYVLIKNSSKNRYIKLVNQSEEYVLSGGQTEPGRLLTKFKNKLENHTELDLLGIATFIKEFNETDLFCPNNKFINIKGIKKFFDIEAAKIVDL